MKQISLESLGLSEETLAEKLVDRIAENLLTTLEYDADAGEWYGSSPFAKKLDKLVKDRLDKIVNDLAEKHVLPKVDTIVDQMVLQETNKWGEKRGSPVTFRQYLVQRADAWMREEVDYRGKTKAEEGFGWSAKGTRISRMVHEHLDYEIGRAMKEALASANSSIAKGLHEAVRIQINEVAKKLKVDVKM